PPPATKSQPLRGWLFHCPQALAAVQMPYVCLALQYSTMFAAHPFALKNAPAASAGLAARATITKTTTIKG
ncbi:MAG TPA: hypothetical protein PKM45_05150, partial [Giesbergeria sp.]|nr:hypothetical protein [Giesbergeria sp.]